MTHETAIDEALTFFDTTLNGQQPRAIRIRRAVRIRSTFAAN
jgi:hypothetical protein